MAIVGAVNIVEGRTCRLIKDLRDVFAQDPFRAERSSEHFAADVTSAILPGLAVEAFLG